MKKGVFAANKKDGTAYFRASISFKGKHISLGSFDSEDEAAKAYNVARVILDYAEQGFKSENEWRFRIDDYSAKKHALSFEKWVVLINLQDNGIYVRNPIYLEKKSFLYYFGVNDFMRFDNEDLFYYSHHKIVRRGGHLFVENCGMQENILNRYGIKNYALKDKDYFFVNGDDKDFRYENIEIVNHYHGVTRQLLSGREVFITKIQINGANIVGRYSNEVDAALAYNKAADYRERHGDKKAYPRNYVDLPEYELIARYNKVRVAKQFKD
ncbi:MAG: hypothetical protein MJ113_04460 [Lachnospiraceae bacterium]|nr:hypothetical protein [Lachnospiraceae bacterium]